MNRRNFFSFLATAPVAATLGVKAAMDANGNNVAPLIGDFWKEGMSPSEVNESCRQIMMTVDCYRGDFGTLRVVKNRFPHNRSSQRFRS